jgi:DNA repair exonuclease SbcCD nuclease subunit
MTTTPAPALRIGLSADWHLGRRLGYRMDARGVNARSADLERAVTAVVDGFIAERVDVAIVAGDLFDSPAPPEHARQALVREIGRLRAALPAATIILLRGNHDARQILSDATAVGTAALALPGVEVVDDPEVRIIRRDGVAFHCLPWMPSDEEFAAAVAALRPDPASARNYVILHTGLARLPEYAELRPGSQTVTDGLLPQGFDGIYSGHYHGHRIYNDINWVFIGSPERLSITESRDPKGWLLIDAATGALSMRHTPARSWYDLSIDATNKSSSQIVEEAGAISAALPDWNEALVRLTIEAIAPETAATIDAGALRRIAGRAFHHELRLRVADPAMIAADGGPLDADGPLFADMALEWARFAEGLTGVDEATRAEIRTIGADALSVRAA